VPRPDSRLLLLFRVLWLIIFVAVIALFSLGVYVRTQTPPPADCEIVTCNPVEPTESDLALLAERGISERAFLILATVANLTFNVGFIVAAIVLFWLRLQDRLALLLSLVLVVFGGVITSPVNDVLFRTRPDLRGVTTGLSMLAYVGLPLLLATFPNGRFVPQKMRWVAILAIGGAGVAGLRQGPDSFGPVVERAALSPAAILVGFAILAAVSQIYRYQRVANTLEKQQAKWGAVGLLGMLMLMLIWVTLATVYPSSEPSQARAVALLTIWPILVLLGFLTPGSFAVAILRYRLWDIDLIIRRTLIYSAVSVVLAAVYFGGVVVLQQVFSAVSGQGSPLAIVLSTLLIAALFRPLRKSMQTIIDRRFYRQKYDAAQTLANFARTTRDEINLDEVTDELLGIIHNTLQPESMSLWLAKSDRET
jgi:hypothetical protein